MEDMRNKTAIGVTGDNRWVLGVVLLSDRDYTGIGEGKNKTNWACHHRWQSP